MPVSVRESITPRRSAPRTRARLRTLLNVVMVVVVAAYVVGLMAKGEQFTPLIDGLLGILVLWIPATVCWLAAGRATVRRLTVVLAAAAVTSFALGDSYYIAVAASGEALSFPSPADIGFLAFYPLMLAALAAPVMLQWKHMAWPVVLDGAVGSLGSAAILAVVLNPILGDVTDGVVSVPAMVAVAYPMFDLLLVAAFVGIGASQGRAVGRRWSFLVLGLVAFATTDISYALLEINGNYEVGGALDAGWAIGLALMALWIESAAQPGFERSFSAWSIPSQTVPTIATAAALVVLLIGSQTTVSLLAVSLAALTLTLAAVPLVFRQRIRLAAMQLQARTDELTGLPNRRALYTDGSARLAVNGRDHGALLMLDLDRFKEVNDSLGHDCGDALLILVAARLRTGLRPSDFLARLGGDEFAVCLGGSGVEEATRVARLLTRIVADPFVLEGVTVRIGVSVGIALYPEQGATLTELMRKADMAMYRAKASRTGCHVYRETDDAAGDERMRARAQVHLAVTNGQLVVHYQPAITVATGEVCGVEALVRWDRPGHGLVYPDELAPLVEEAKLTAVMTWIVLEMALDEIAVWRAHGRDWTVSVGVPAGVLGEADFPERVHGLVVERALAPNALILDVSEEFLRIDRIRSKNVLVRLRNLGIRVALSDFGSGYSSLSHLRDLPIDDLKLGSSFIGPMDRNPRAEALVASAVGLAHSLGLRLIAEGVETGTTFDSLARHGCDVAQGPFLSLPITAQQLDSWLTGRLAHREAE